MAGIQIAPGRHGQVLCAGSAAGQPLGHAGSSLQVDHEMEEVESFAFLFSLDHNLCKTVVLFTDLRNVLLTDGVGIRLVPHHRLDGHLLKSKIRKMQDVVGEIQVVPCERAPDIVSLLVSAVRQLLELGNDQVIAAFAVPERTHIVVDLFTPIQAENHIVHLLVDEILDLIV